MAVKKATAKKSVAKKAAAKKPAKKSAPKKATAKATKKSPAKKTAAKKTVVKKAATKKKATSKATKKRVAKKAATKRVASRKGAETIVIPEAPISAARSARVEIVSTPAPAPVIIPSAPTPTPNPVKKQGASGRVVFAVVVGIIILAAIVWAKGHNRTTDEKPSATPTATASATPSSSATDSASPTPSASASATLTAHGVPQGVVAHYTSTGATIFWKAPTAVDGLTGYNVEISVSNGPWKLISTVPSTQMSLDVKKENTSGWTSFRVSSVYSDSQTAPAKAFGLPGTYS